jgi:hypothetical protein
MNKGYTSPPPCLDESSRQEQSSSNNQVVERLLGGFFGAMHGWLNAGTGDSLELLIDAAPQRKIEWAGTKACSACEWIFRFASDVAVTIRRASKAKQLSTHPNELNAMLSLLVPRWETIRVALQAQELPDPSAVESEIEWELSQAESHLRRDVSRINGGTTAPGAQPKPKRTRKHNTKRGDGETKISAALAKHHQYENNSCLNWAPIGVRELAQLAGVGNATVSRFFNNKFDNGKKAGYSNYKWACQNDRNRLLGSLRILQGDVTPHMLFKSGYVPGT